MVSHKRILIEDEVDFSKKRDDRKVSPAQVGPTNTQDTFCR